MHGKAYSRPCEGSLWYGRDRLANQIFEQENTFHSTANTLLYFPFLFKFVLAKVHQLFHLAPTFFFIRLFNQVLI